MGVKLQAIIVRKNVDFQELHGKTIAIDAPNIIMGLFNFVRKNSDGSSAGLILDNTQRPISHLYGLLYRINFLYSKKIFPLFCFDGKVSELKRVITKNQLKDFLFTQQWYQEAIRTNNKELARYIALSKEYMWQNIIKESKQLLGCIGIPYIDAPASAESQCAYLVKKKIVDYSNSQDFDSLLFGCPQVIQNLSKSLRRKIQGRWQYQKIQPVKINLNKTLENLKITLFQLVDLGILMGTDYFPGIKNIGPKKALTLIRKYNTIEQVIMNERHNYDFQTLTPELIRKVRKLFLIPEVIEDINDVVWTAPNKAGIYSLLCKEHNLNRERVKTTIIKLEKNYENCRQYFLFNKGKTRSRQITLDALF
ncbi:MAG: hypothetical protein ACFFC3_09405 [Candidatus Odinarchaeota archaeon]